MAESASEARTVHNTNDDKISSPPSLHVGVDSTALLDEFTNADKTKTTPDSNSDNNESDVVSDDNIDNNTAAAAAMVDVPVDDFPSKRPSIVNRFTNQDPIQIDQGYDSEGGTPYIDDTIPDDDINEAPLPSEPPPTPAVAVAAMPVQPTLTVEQVATLGVTRLKEELKKRGQTIGGKKAELQQRLIDAIQRNIPVATVEESNMRHECMNGLDMTAHWVLLKQNPIPVPAPINTDPTLRPPTELDDKQTNARYRYDEQFDRAPFTGSTAKMQYMYHSSPKKKKRSIRKLSPSNKSKAKKVPTIEQRKKGGPNDEFLKRYGLDETSHPIHWVNALMPFTQADNKEKEIGSKKFSVSNWAAYSRTKGQLVNAGQEGHLFAGRYEEMQPSDMSLMLGIYLSDGLSPSPQLRKKMKSQQDEKIHGNDFICDCIKYYSASDAEQLYRSFRHLLGVQDPLTVPPPKQECPNFKVDEFFEWMRHIFKEAWLLGPNFAIDEQTAKMQGTTEYKTRCGKYKRIGDGIQADAIADDGYTWTFYFRNEPVKKKWLDKGMSPLHARVLHMLEQLRDKGHRCKMDNLFNSVRLAREAYHLPQKVLTDGVIRKSGRGVPPDVFQDEKKGNAAEKERGTIKAAVLKGDSKSSDLVITSLYDQKPFYMLSHSCEEITWDMLTKRVYSASQKEKIDFDFLRFNLSNDYNNEMNDNDIADQLRLVYRMMRFQRNYKWWWALWIWGIEVTVVNAYVMMKRYCELKDVPVPYSHHDFHEAVALAFLDRDNQFGNHWPRKQAAGQKRKSAFATPSPAKKARKAAPRLTKQSVCPRFGALRGRLDLSLGHYLSGEPDSNRVCQLHRYAYRQMYDDPKGIPSGARLHVYTCEACGVNLCIPCMKIFHTTEYFEDAICTIINE